MNSDTLNSKIFCKKHKRLKTNGFMGFSLVEILVTLAVIGVISTLTIPSLMRKTNNEEYVVRLKKAYSTMSQATNKIILENGTPKCSIGGWACSSVAVADIYKKYLNKVKECPQGNQCTPDKYTFLKGATSVNFSEETSGASKGVKERTTFLLADGTAMTVVGINGTCAGYDNGNINGCYWIRVDVNGLKKPNKFGRDAFQFVAKENGLYPSGCDAKTRVKKTPKEVCVAAGWHCACPIITEGKMDY